MIEIRPYVNRAAQLRLLVVTALFLALTVQSARTLTPLIRSGHEVIGCSYIAIFAFMTAVSARRFAWFLRGHEEIVLRGGLLSVSRRLGLLKTSRVYRLRDIKDIHVVFRLTTAFSISQGRLGFVYEGKMRYMADRISTQEARKMASLFREWLPKELWTPVLGL